MFGAKALVSQAPMASRSPVPHAVLCISDSSISGWVMFRQRHMHPRDLLFRQGGRSHQTGELQVW